MTISLHWGWPQALLVLWLLAGLAVHAAKHGRPHEHGFHVGYSLARTVLVLWLLVSGGFFSPAHAQPIPAAANQYRAELTRAAHTQWGLNAPIAALAAQVHQESGWQPHAVSRVGAQGMAQFMPATATWWCSRNGLAPADCQPTNPTWALRALVGYDKHLYSLAPANYSNHDRMWVALRAYNGGLGHWRAEASAFTAFTGLKHPTRLQVDAACGLARRHVTHCPENLAYPARILGVLQPRYAAWGPSVTEGQN